MNRSSAETPSYSPKSSDLAGSNVQAKRTWVIILEELKISTRHGADLVTDSLAGWAGEGRYDGRSTWSDGLGSEVLGHTLVGVGGRLGGDGGELLEVDGAVAGEGEGGGLEVFLLGEEEDERAGAGVGGWDVEVEDGGDGGGDCAVVFCAGGLVWGGGVNWDDQVGVLVLAVEVGWAA
jgi:hypothetical protein